MRLIIYSRFGKVESEVCIRLNFCVCCTFLICIRQVILLALLHTQSYVTELLFIESTLNVERRSGLGVKVWAKVSARIMRAGSAVFIGKRQVLIL